LPEDLRLALKKNAKARAIFDDSSPRNRREYIEWITDAKTDATRTRRLKTAIEWIAAGKPRNWKYINSRRRDGLQPGYGQRARTRARARVFTSGLRPGAGSGHARGRGRGFLPRYFSATFLL
jgi:hypothetical protein